MTLFIFGLLAVAVVTLLAGWVEKRLVRKFPISPLMGDLTRKERRSLLLVRIFRQAPGAAVVTWLFYGGFTGGNVGMIVGGCILLFFVVSAAADRHKEIVRPYTIFNMGSEVVECGYGHRAVTGLACSPSVLADVVEKHVLATRQPVEVYAVDDGRRLMVRTPHRTVHIKPDKRELVRFYLAVAQVLPPSESELSGCVVRVNGGRAQTSLLRAEEVQQQSMSTY